MGRSSGGGRVDGGGLRASERALLLPERCSRAGVRVTRGGGGGLAAFLRGAFLEKEYWRE